MNGDACWGSSKRRSRSSKRIGADSAHVPWQRAWPNLSATLQVGRRANERKSSNNDSEYHGLAITRFERFVSPVKSGLVSAGITRMKKSRDPKSLEPGARALEAAQQLHNALARKHLEAARAHLVALGLLTPDMDVAPNMILELSKKLPAAAK
jgi:hypothetical protein